MWMVFRRIRGVKMKKTGVGYNDRTDEKLQKDGTERYPIRKEVFWCWLFTKAYHDIQAQVFPTIGSRSTFNCRGYKQGERCCQETKGEQQSYCGIHVADYHSKSYWKMLLQDNPRKHSCRRSFWRQQWWRYEIVLWLQLSKHVFKILKFCSLTRKFSGAWQDRQRVSRSQHKQCYSR